MCPLFVGGNLGGIELGEGGRKGLDTKGKGNGKDRDSWFRSIRVQLWETVEEYLAEIKFGKGNETKFLFRNFSTLWKYSNQVITYVGYNHVRKKITKLLKYNLFTASTKFSNFKSNLIIIFE